MISRFLHFLIVSHFGLHNLANNLLCLGLGNIKVTMHLTPQKTNQKLLMIILHAMNIGIQCTPFFPHVPPSFSHEKLVPKLFHGKF